MSRIIKTNKDKLLIGVISDTHIPSEASAIPDAVFNDFKEKNIDYLFHVGDFTSFETYENLVNVFGNDKVVAVLGNMDFDPKLRKILPATMEVEVLGHKIFMVHGGGSPHSIIKKIQNDHNLSEQDIIIFGHTHNPYKEEIDGKLFLNPGSVNDKRFTTVNSYGYLKISKQSVEFEIVVL